MKKIPEYLALFALAFTLTASAFAKPKSADIKVYQDVTLNGTNVPAGEYVVKYDVDGSIAHVKIMKGNHEIASADGQVKTLSARPDANQIVVDTAGNARSISEIDFGGKETAIAFQSTGATAGK